MALFLPKDNNCAKLFWNPCINVQVMARKSSIYDHFDLYLTPVTLTFKLHKKMFQIALFLLEDNNCADIFLKSVNKCTIYGPDKLNICQFWPLFDPWNLDLQPTLKCFKRHFSSSRKPTVQNYLWNSCINVHVISLAYKTGFHLIFRFPAWSKRNIILTVNAQSNHFLRSKAINKHFSGGNL